MYIHTCIYVYICVHSTQRDPNPNRNSLIRERCRKRGMESLMRRCVRSY